MAFETDGEPDRGDAKHENAARRGARTETGASGGGRERPENAQEDMSERLDEGLEETFPSSDPVSVKITK